ncbi:hypothetical protein AGJ02_04950 [Cronobacter sakazakii]|nr:hypothetical protein [Cronobacter sakazakii]EGZ6999405.1 hypothetical protein [Cronobacter sakazakii]EGZ7010064.1 hypothetical protein [Cronobacter sakazakii]EGZ7012520.1 hypothetical protein [Cronobacter sakazakii]EGZ7017458.1 hypothetical protein [Cronobacter sakazakii]
MVVILVVLTKETFLISFYISQLLAKAIPVRGARFKKARFLAGFLLLDARSAIETCAIAQK